MKLSILLLFICQFCFSQNQIEFSVLNTIEPNENYEDFEKIVEIFKNRKIIGVGECTHGTSEFTTMRQRLFKYLVEKHGFTVFFLEADFSACERVNRYINGADDLVVDALMEVQLWPWLTEEMIKLIEWCKLHNETATSKISFVGSDMQLINDDKIELKRFFFNQKNIVSTLEDIFKELEIEKKDSIAVKSAFNKWNKFNDTTNFNFLDSEKNKNYNFLKLNIDQWFQNEISKGYKYNFRDSCMANNMLTYLDRHRGEKGFYFAHNWHISETIYEYKNGLTATKTAGRYLSEEIKSEYLSIGQTSNQGRFNALTYSSDKYQMLVHKLEPSKKKTLERTFSKLNKSILFCSINDFSYIENLRFTSIGAIYKKSSSGYKVKRYGDLKNENYDAFIFIENTKESKLLKKL